MIFNYDVSELNNAVIGLEEDNDKLKENLATVELTNTASKNYSVGEYAVVNGYFCIVTSAISAGQTFSTNTNIKVVNVGDSLKAKEYSIKYYGNSIVTSTDGTLHSSTIIRLAYNDTDVLFHARVILQNMTAGTRPTITLTHNDFINCPSFVALGNPVLRGVQGNYSDECYANHSKGQNTITITQNNFLSSATTLQAGWGVYQIPGVALT